MLFEHKTDPILSRPAFFARMARFGLVGLGFLSLSLLIGMTGYHITEKMDWLDALLNASMILGGMGPVDALHTVAGKLFASFYALFSGVVFITLMAIILTPVIHRIMHRVHMQVDDKDDDGSDNGK